MDLFDVTTGVADTINNVGEGIKEGISTAATNVKEGISTVATNVKEGVSTAATNVKEGVTNTVETAKQKISETAEKVDNARETVVTGVANAASSANDFFKLDKEELQSRINEIKSCNTNISNLVEDFNKSMTDLFDSGFFSTLSSQRTYESFKSSYEYATRLRGTIDDYVTMLSTKVLASADSVDSYLAREASSFENLVF